MWTDKPDCLTICRSLTEAALSMHAIILCQLNVGWHGLSAHRACI